MSEPEIARLFRGKKRDFVSVSLIRNLPDVLPEGPELVELVRQLLIDTAAEISTVELPPGENAS